MLPFLVLARKCLFLLLPMILRHFFSVETSSVFEYRVFSPLLAHKKPIDRSLTMAATLQQRYVPLKLSEILEAMETMGLQNKLTKLELQEPHRHKEKLRLLFIEIVSADGRCMLSSKGCESVL
jgi:hypothetical protein